MTSRQAMIDSAIVLFRRRGVAATSLRDVVEHSGAPRGSIYHHFPGGKDQLAGEATVWAGGFIASLLERLTQGDPAAAVTSFVEHWERSLRDADFQDGCPVAAAALSGGAPSAVQAAGEAFETWERLLAAALERSGRSATDAASLATFVVAAVEGALILSRAQGSDTALRRVAEQLRALLAAP